MSLSRLNTLRMLEQPLTVTTTQQQGEQTEVGGAHGGGTGREALDHGLAAAAAGRNEAAMIA